MRAGADVVAFSGRIGRRALAPRVYGAVLTASNAGGRSKPVGLVFIVCVEESRAENTTAAVAPVDQEI
jgi:hypothetical protein